MYGLMDFCENFNFEVEKIVETVKLKKLKRLYIQLPEGFQRCAKHIVDRIGKLMSEEVEIFISANPSYGSCLVDELGAKDVHADMVVHFGHAPYPHYKYSVDVLFVPVEYEGVDRIKLLEIIERMCTDERERICLATTPQHINITKSICSEIRKCNCIYRGVVTGCYLAESRDCNKLIIVGGGRFHCIAQALYEFRGNPNNLAKILCLDPYSYSIWSPVKDVEKLLRVRLWKMHQAINTGKWLIVDGFYGQHRGEIIAHLTKMLKAHNKDFSIVKALKLDREFLVNLEADRSFDVIVIASCPYLAFDFIDFEKPVLTVGEALMVLSGDVGRYAYPW